MEYHGERFEDHSLLIFDRDVLISIFPANESHRMIYSHQGLTYGGLLTDSGIRMKHYLHVYEEVLKYYHELGIEWVQLKTIPRIYSFEITQEVDYLIFKTQAQLTRTDVLAVVKPKNRIYSTDRKAGIKRGLKNKLKVVEMDDFTEFWNEILIPNLKNKYDVAPVHSLEEIKELKEKFPINIRQFNVYHENDIVAGTTIFESKRVAHSQYISSNSDKNNLGSLDYLHDYLLKNIFINKKYFDFGSSNENIGQQINEGLLYWKEGFGARVVPHHFYSIPTEAYKKLKSVFV